MHGDAPETPTNLHTQQQVSRRELLRMLGAVGGITAGFFVLPTAWRQPRLEFGILPAHAACSTPSTAPACSIASTSVNFTGTPLVAPFALSRRGFVNGPQMSVQIDSKTLIVQVSAASPSTIVSASMGAVASNVLTYTWQPNQTNNINCSVPDVSGCATGIFNVSFNAAITLASGTYTLALSRFSGDVCISS